MKLKLKLRDISTKTGVSIAHLSAIELGRYAPSILYLCIIRRALGMREIVG